MNFFLEPSKSWMNHGLTLAIAFGIGLGLFSATTFAQPFEPPQVQKIEPQRDQGNRVGIQRLLQRSEVDKQSMHDRESDATRSLHTVPEAACLVPSTIENSGAVRLAAGDSSSNRRGFASRQDVGPCPVVPLPLGRIERAQAAATHIQITDRNKPRSDEYIYDGNDRGQRTTVDASWQVYGLDTEDTVGHFDTLDGQRIVTPSNRVAIYAPRFAAVRKLDGFVSASQNQSPVAQAERMQTVYSQRSDRMTSAKQNLALNRHIASRKATGLLDQTRGVVADNVTNLFGFRNAFEAYANIGMIQRGQYDSAQGPVLAQGIQSAVAWETDLGLRVFAKGIQPIVVRDVRTVQELLSIESEDGSAMLRVVKVADKMSAKTGEEVEFTLRFDNISRETIGNVTLMDNLTRRLEYVDGSQECSVEANFVNEVNEDDSLLLRWEVKEPLEAGKGGVIRFRCRVR